MRIAYFDTIAGASGDMTLAAFISAGLPIDELRAEIAKLQLTGVELDARHIVRNGITAVRLDVVVSAKQTHHRHLKDIFGIIDGSLLSDRVKRDARKIFTEVAKAEAKVHNSTLEKIHFHEVGAIDSIVDIVGAAICFEKLGIEAVYSSPVKLGSGGFVRSEHGKLPLPAPATAEILRGYPVSLTALPYELTTPTGAAIIRSMSRGTLAMEQLSVESIGYGAGTMEIPEIPNLLRIFVGELHERHAADQLVVIEANIDNMNPEIYPYVIEKLLSAGANDAYLTPVIMKKGRPAIVLSVIVERGKTGAISELLFRQTTTIGVRVHEIERITLSRRESEVRTSFGMVRCKIVSLNGSERQIPEFEECKRIAEEKGLSLREVSETLNRELNV